MYSIIGKGRRNTDSLVRRFTQMGKRSQICNKVKNCPAKHTRNYSEFLIALNLCIICNEDKHEALSFQVSPNFPNEIHNSKTALCIRNTNK